MPPHEMPAGVDLDLSDVQPAAVALPGLLRRAVRWLNSLVRMLVLRGLSAVPLVGWLIDPVMVLATDDGRRVGDRAAGTQVIAQRDYRGDGPLTTT